MDSKRLAITGTGLMVAGIGLSALGAALILPAILELTADLADKVGGRLSTEVERASRTVGTAAGALHRSFNEAAKAGTSELRKAMASTNEDS